MPYKLQSVPKTCERGPSGVHEMYIIDGAKIQNLLFNGFERIDTIEVISGATLKKIEFEHDVAFFTQTQSRSGGHPRVNQSVSIQHQGIDNTVIRSIKRIAESCDIHIIVVLNNGQKFYLGISYYADRGFIWDSANTAVTSGSANSQALGGNFSTTTVFSGQVRQYAPEIDYDLSLLPVELPPPPDPTVDNTAPEAIIFVPSDDSTSVGVLPDIFIIFNEAVKDSGGGGRILLYDYDTDTLIGAWNMSVVTFSSIDNSARLPALGSPLSNNHHYYILVDGNAIEDIAGNDWGGVSSKTEWDFWTIPLASQIPPVVVTLSPPDEATGISKSTSTATITFDKDVVAGVGSIILLDYSDNSIVKVYDVNGPDVSFSGAVCTIDITSDLADGKHYYFVTNAGSIEDTDGNSFAGLHGNEAWDFETATTGAFSNGFSRGFDIL